MNAYQELFPFFKVPKNASIVIWGCGNVGSQYYDQVIRTGYCTLKYVVDKNWESMSGKKFPVCNPEKLKQEKESIVVIANALTEQQNEIKAKLKEYGIEDERVVCECCSLPMGDDVRLEVFKSYHRNLKIRKAMGHALVRMGNQYDGGYIMLDDFQGGEDSVFYWDIDRCQLGQGHGVKRV